MDQFKHIFNPTSLYDTLFFTVITTTKYGSLSEFIEKDNDMYQHWNKIAIKRFGDASEDIYLEKGQYMDEFSVISAIGYGGFFIKNDKIESYYRYFSGNEKEIVERFFAVLEDFRRKKLDGFLCGHNISGHHIPMLSKVGIKYGLDLPTSFKHNLTAKPWENSILDTVNLWKFTGSAYTSLELISDYLGIQSERIDFNRVNRNFHANPDFSLDLITKVRYEQLIKLYSKLRNM